LSIGFIIVRGYPRLYGVDRVKKHASGSEWWMAWVLLVLSKGQESAIVEPCDKVRGFCENTLKG